MMFNLTNLQGNVQGQGHFTLWCLFQSLFKCVTV